MGDAGDARFELDPPLTQVAWSPEFGSRSLEIFLVCLVDDRPWVLQPIHAESLIVGWRPDDQPGTVVVEAARRYGLEPVLVHSDVVAGRRRPSRLDLPGDSALSERSGSPPGDAADRPR